MLTERVNIYLFRFRTRLGNRAHLTKGGWNIKRIRKDLLNFKCKLRERLIAACAP